MDRSQWLSGLLRGFAAACLLGMRVRIKPGAWIAVSSVSVVCYLGARLCDRPIPCSEESYRM
jgi:hypothetical protein